MSILAHIGLGANLGAAHETVQAALKDLAAEPGIELVKVAPLYSSAPIDSSGPNYINTVASIHTSLGPEQLLTALQRIELVHGRERPYVNAPRTFDLDLLLYDDITLNTPMLTIPHPRMHLRAFVLQPLRDIAGNLTLSQGSLDALLAQCSDQGLTPLP
jgi:2-amino-4-hydroxy-6-hydroxymethyldihydropteridine diphosphokinase